MGSIGAVVLAGGRATRMSGVVKPAIPVGGVRMLDRVVSALRQCDPIVVVGPDTLALPSGAIRVQEEPVGGGPVAALGAALDQVAVRATALVVVVGGDLPILSGADVAQLLTSLADTNVDGAVYVDATGRRQWLCGAWRTASIATRLREFETEHGRLANGAVRALFDPLRFIEVQAGEDRLPPYFDCDTDEDIKRAEEWLRR